MKFIIHWLVSTVALLVVAYLFKGVVIDSYLAALIAALVLGIVNAIIRPIIMILTLPINILTLGLFTLIINALMLWMVHLLVPGFYIISFTAAIWAAIIYWLINWFLSLIFANEKQS